MGCPHMVCVGHHLRALGGIQEGPDEVFALQGEHNSPEAREAQQAQIRGGNLHLPSIK